MPLETAEQTTPFFATQGQMQANVDWDQQRDFDPCLQKTDKRMAKNVIQSLNCVD